MGWLLRFIHMNNVSLLNIFLILHIFRGIRYISYKRFTRWLRGVAIIMAFFLSAFLGYVLP